MNRPASDDFRELVRSRTDLVALIGESVALQSARGGLEFVGICPFHDDHRPSMRVYPDRQSFRCWACNTGGDCYSYVMLREKVEFREALELLATRAGLDMPANPSRSGNGDPIGKPRLYEILSWAEREFHEFLLTSPAALPAREYLSKRGMTADTLKRFRLGFHPDNWEWLLRRARGKFTTDQLIAARLCGARTSGQGHYDYFTNRIMFPIWDNQGRCVAFGGRVLPGTQSEGPKYWNSPESPVFAKSRLLYGLDRARDAVQKTGVVVVVEGYTDCILAHQGGLENFVCTLGTALTEAHVTALRRFARKVVLIYDGDAAGQNASERSLSRLLAQEADLRLLALPGGRDPADAILEFGKEWFEEQIKHAPEVWEYKLRRVTERHGTESVDACHLVLEEMLELLCEVPVHFGGVPAGSWQLRENILLGKLSHRLGLPESLVRQRLTELRSRRPRGAKPGGDSVESQREREIRAELTRLRTRPTRDDQLECELLEVLLTHPGAIRAIRSQLRCDEVRHALLRQLLKLCYDLDDADAAPGFARVMAELEDPQLKNLVALLDDQARKKQVQPNLVDETLKCLQKRRDLAPASTASRPDGQPRTPVDAADPKALLRQASEHHRKRHARPSPN